MSVKNRLKEYIKSQKMTISNYEKDINVSNGYVNSIAKGVGGEVLLKIIEKSPNLNIEWLLTGEGSMLKKEYKGNINQNITADGSIMVGGSVGGSINNNAINNETQLLENKLKEYQKKVKEKDQEIKRLKNQIDKLFKLIP